MRSDFPSLFYLFAVFFVFFSSFFFCFLQLTSTRASITSPQPLLPSTSDVRESHAVRDAIWNQYRFTASQKSNRSLRTQLRQASVERSSGMMSRPPRETVKSPLSVWLRAARAPRSLPLPLLSRRSNPRAPIRSSSRSSLPRDSTMRAGKPSRTHETRSLSLFLRERESRVT